MLALLTLLAAGFFYPDLGARPLGRGATGAAGAGDLSTLNSNPAGLLELDGLRIQAEIASAWQPATFQRAGFCGSGQNACPSVSSDGSAFFNTVSGASYRRGDFAFALGAYGPPSVGRFQWPDPRQPSNDVSLSAPQRYSLIESNNFALYPGAAVAWRAAQWLDAGLVVQLRTFHVHQAQSIFVLGGIGGDVPEADAVATFDAKDTLRLDGGLGVIARPIEGLAVGLSARPAMPVHATGTLDVDSKLASLAGITVSGRSAKVDLTLPASARFGVKYERPRWMAEVDVVWEGWGALREIVVTPLDVVLKSGSGANETDTKVAPIRLAKNYRGSFSFRGGGEWAPFDLGAIGLRLRAGALYETGAIPDATLQVDFPNPPRGALTLGATLEWRALTATLGWAHFLTASATVSNSIATRVDPFPAPDFIIGNGSYSTSLDVVALQLAWTFAL